MNGDGEMQMRSLHFLYGLLKRSRIAYGRAEEKPGSHMELACLASKIDMLEWTIAVVNREECKNEHP